jgi:hypothetical protein
MDISTVFSSSLYSKQQSSNDGALKAGRALLEKA